MKTAGKKILVVENNKTEQTIRKLLSENEYDLSFADNNTDAFSMIIQEKIDLVLIENETVDNGSIRFCEIIKSNEDLQEIPVIFFVSQDDKKETIRVFEAGADDYITKPFNLNEIINKIDMRLMLQVKKTSILNKYNENLKQMKLLNSVVKKLKADIETEKTKTACKQKQQDQKYVIESIKNQFLKIIVQEMRTPTSAIIGFTDILKESDSSEENGFVLKTIADASRRAKELLDTALLVSEIDHDKTANNIRPYKISNLLEFAVNDHSEQIRNKNIRVNYPDESELSESVIDPGLIKAVLSAFLSNAVLHCPPKGNIDFIIEESIDKIELRIQDEGPGFDANNLEKISQFLSSPGVSKRSEWPGLRFAVAKFIMDIHHAEIMIENNPTGGASVKLIFPVNNEEREALHQLLSQLN